MRRVQEEASTSNEQVNNKEKTGKSQGKKRASTRKERHKNIAMMIYHAS